MATVDQSFSGNFQPVQYDSFNSGGGGGFSPQQTQGGGGSSWNPSMLPGAQGGVFAQPGKFGNPAAPAQPAQDPQIARMNGGESTGPNMFNGANWNPTFEQFGGYNPSQYASTETANTLAGAMGSGLGLGGRVIQTQNAPGSPIGPPPQAMIDFGGADPLNAGLLAERYKKYDHATADAMTRAELGQMGQRQAPNADSQGGSMGSWSMFGDRPGGSQNLGGGQNIGQFVGENQGSAFGAVTGGGGASQTPYQPQQTPQYQPQAPSAPQAQPQAPARPQYGTRQNYGGFGQAGNFQSANSGAGIQQLLQMLLGGNGGTLQQAGRRSPFQAGSMSGMAGSMNGFQGRQSFNPYSQGMNYGGGQGKMGYYPQYQ